MSNEDLSELAAQTQAVYERNAELFAKVRSKEMQEKPWLDRFLGLLPAGGDILDLGCGPAVPIGRYFSSQGNRVVGLDASPNMIRLAQQNLPDGDWRVADMRAFDLDERFDGIIAWNSFFHLMRDEQRCVLPKMAAHLRPGGALLLSVGTHDGEVAGHVGEDAIYHSSLSPQEYEDILGELGLRVVAFRVEDQACYGMTLLLAQKAV